VDDVVVEGVVTSLDLAAGDTEYVALAAVFRCVGSHVDYLPTSCITLFIRCVVNSGIYTEGTWPRPPPVIWACPQVAPTFHTL